MNITEIRIRLVGENKERLRAFCSVTLDGAIVIRDLKVIDGPSGPFVAMPSRKLADHCGRCHQKNHLRARFCNECGARLPDDRAILDEHGRVKLHADIAHPINSAAREELQQLLVSAYEAELRRSRLPGYEPPSYEHESVTEGFERAARPEHPVRQPIPDVNEALAAHEADRSRCRVPPQQSPSESFGSPRSTVPRGESPKSAVNHGFPLEEDPFSAGIG